MKIDALKKILRDEWLNRHEDPDAARDKIAHAIGIDLSECDGRQIVALINGIEE